MNKSPLSSSKKIKKIDDDLEDMRNVLLKMLELQNKDRKITLQAIEHQQKRGDLLFKFILISFFISFYKNEILWISSNFLKYMLNLYEQSDAGSKIDTILTIIGLIISFFIGRYSKK
ncbi:MAG: hypothetical protein H6774_03330 [Pseudomonadales bacterium]|nr:hypothetical protein [Pseudomonadales bacterium]